MKPHCLFTVPCLLLLLAGSLIADETPQSDPETETSEAPAAILLEPGEKLPPMVQLLPEAPAVPWDPDQVGEFSLVDQDGNTVTQESLLGKPWVVNFIFCRCAYQCPLTCRKIMELSQELRNVDVRFVTITVDPEYDTPEVMKEFARIWGAEPERWLFLTGDVEEVWRLIRSGFKVAAWEMVGTERMPGMEFAHSNHMIHIDETGRILGRYDSGIDAELVTLSRVLKGQIETPDQFRPAQRDEAEAFENLRQNGRASNRGETDPLLLLPVWARRLPATNAMLNALATFLLLLGFFAIKAGRAALHKQLMLTAFLTSILFLGCYLTYHFALHHYAGISGKPYSGTGLLRPIYFGILISHVILAAAVPVLAVVTIVKGLRENWPSHRRWAKVTFPIWLYVSVTGVIIYVMLYHT